VVRHSPLTLTARVQLPVTLEHEICIEISKQGMTAVEDCGVQLPGVTLP